jgi:hypothetical protein
MTRRTVLRSGAAIAAVACTAGFGAYDPFARNRRETQSIDALCVDETIVMPSQLAAFIKAGSRTVHVIGIRLDAAAHAGLLRVLDQSQTIAGISSGATLFCLERIGWDHGFRLTGRSQRCAGDFGDDVCRLDVVEFLGGAGVHGYAASALPIARAYRPSRADGTLHAWVMQKSARGQLSPARGEV